MCVQSNASYTLRGLHDKRPELLHQQTKLFRHDHKSNIRLSIMAGLLRSTLQSISFLESK